ncbi:MAG TPA: transglutaminase-like domain-containing protein, partial [Isosphaeraceae bacterium]|nr:transglutaminase-like domain-containing protein [Isosphaeraceae bacterium]
MTFDPGMVVVPASEAVRKRRGTCMAYSVLLATLARAAGIPSRMAMGYVYVAGVWGGHAWVEVMAGDRWVPLDGALPGPGTCDAARVCCLRSSLARGLGAELGPLMQLFGNLDIAIVEYDQDSVRTKVPGTAKSHVIDGDVYRNVWLGITVRKPAGFEFCKLEAIYPDRAVLGLEGPAKALVELRQLDLGIAGDSRAACAARLSALVPNGAESEISMSGRKAVAASNGRKAACAVADKADMWVLTVEAENAAGLLKEIAARLVVGTPGPVDAGAER